MAEWFYRQAGELYEPKIESRKPLTTAALKPIAKAFFDNLGRIVSFWSLPPMLVELASVNVINSCMAQQALFGRVGLSPEQAEDPNILEQIQGYISEQYRRRLAQGIPIEKAFGYDEEAALDRFDHIIRGDAKLDEAIYATLLSQITQVWTVFETLAGDLWESALNASPAVLAALKGRKSRISKSAGASDDSEDLDEFEPTLRDFERATKGTYDAKNVMGSLLRDNFSFQRLSGIRSAYSAAFSKNYDAIDASLACRELDALNLVRNVILHKSGVADEIYIKRIQSYPNDYVDELKKPIKMDGKRVKALANPAIESAFNLLIAVDEWLSQR